MVSVKKGAIVTLIKELIEMMENRIGIWRDIHFVKYIFFYLFCKKTKWTYWKQIENLLKIIRKSP